MTDAPERIWLLRTREIEPIVLTTPPAVPEIADSVEYVRADLHDALLTRLASAEAALARAREDAFDACINLCAEVRDGKHDDAYARSGIDAGEDFIASLIRALRNGETGGAMPVPPARSGMCPICGTGHTGQCPAPEDGPR